MNDQIASEANEFTGRFSPTRRGARLARRLAEYQLDEWGIPYGDERSDAVALIVAELVANAITHGHVPGRDFELRIMRDSDGGGVLRIEVSDARGDRRPVPHEPSGGESHGHDHGHGLRLVDALADKWGVSERLVGKTVWAEFSPSLARPASAPCPP
ncbi:ATP-binding protein [Streptomyces sp. E11-3]|uniref:ATP-binding protein n=1 Tax=Streptomyces sp. E11-3 TaxID=3110112 RepID=UPI00397F9E30